MSAVLDQVKDIMGKRVRVVLDDDRVIDGTLQALDKDMNLIIGDSTEFHRMLNKDNKDSIEFFDERMTKLPSRHLGMAMVPGKNLRAIFQEKADE